MNTILSGRKVRPEESCQGGDMRFIDELGLRVISTGEIVRHMNETYEATDGVRVFRIRLQWWCATIQSMAGAFGLLSGFGFAFFAVYHVMSAMFEAETFTIRFEGVSFWLWLWFMGLIICVPLYFSLKAARKRLKKLLEAVTWLPYEIGSRSDITPYEVQLELNQIRKGLPAQGGFDVDILIFEYPHRHPQGITRLKLRDRSYYVRHWRI